MRHVDVLAYYFPQYHPDPRNDRLHQPGWTEWDVAARARPHYDGHAAVHLPVGGPQDESLPQVAGEKVALASACGLDGFIVDWYWYEGGPFLEGFLQRGLLPALVDDPFRFALMWANHPWTELYPAPQGPQQTLLSAPVSRDSFEQATAHVIETYLGHPNYWRLHGRPYFSIYDVPSLIAGLGGLAATRAALDTFRAQAQRAGHELHLNLVTSQELGDEGAALHRLGADSTTHYTWWHLPDNGFTTFPATPYAVVADRARAAWPTQSPRLGVPYLPNVTVGWDPSARTVAWAHDRDRGYPYTCAMNERQPELLESALRDAVDSARRDTDGPSAVTVNAWNEWTEDSYLEPDERHGDAYLQAVRRALTTPRTTDQPESETPA